MRFNIRSGMSEVWGLIILRNIRGNILYYLNRIIIGIIFLGYLLSNSVVPNFSPFNMLYQHFVLIIAILMIATIISLIIHCIQKGLINSILFYRLNNYLIDFSQDAISVITSSFTIFVPTLCYGIIIGNFEMLSMAIFILLFLDMLEGVKFRLKFFYFRFFGSD